MVEQAVARHDLDWRYLTFEVGPDELGDAVRGLRALGFRGAHCAAPHQQAVVPLLDRTTDTAATIGAVNIIFREENSLVGDNTEGKGIVQAIRGALDPAGKHVVLLGAGQIARAVAVELARPAWPALRSSTARKAGRPSWPRSCRQVPGPGFDGPLVWRLCRAARGPLAGQRHEHRTRRRRQPRRLPLVGRHASARFVGGRRDCQRPENVAPRRGSTARLQDHRWLDHVHRASGHRAATLDGSRSRSPGLAAEAAEDFLGHL